MSSPRHLADQHPTYYPGTNLRRRRLVIALLTCAVLAGGAAAANWLIAPGNTSQLAAAPSSDPEKAPPKASTPQAQAAQDAWPQLCQNYAASLATSQNGRIAPDLLAALSWAPHQSLRPDAAAQLERLNQAYRAHFGADLTVVSAYRTIISQQANAEQMPDLAAEVGTSNHGWGIAIDLGGGAGTYGTPEHLWLRDNAPEFGWVLPPWADVDGSKTELWHWEFWGTPTTAQPLGGLALDQRRLSDPAGGMVEVDPAMWQGHC